MTFPSRSRGRCTAQGRRWHGDGGHRGHLRARRRPSRQPEEPTGARPEAEAAPVPTAPPGPRPPSERPSSRPHLGRAPCRPLAGRCPLSAVRGSRRRHRPPAADPQPLAARSRKRKAEPTRCAGAAPPRGRGRGRGPERGGAPRQLSPRTLLEAEPGGAGFGPPPGGWGARGGCGGQCGEGRPGGGANAPRELAGRGPGRGGQCGWGAFGGIRVPGASAGARDAGGAEGESQGKKWERGGHKKRRNRFATREEGTVSTVGRTD